MPYGIELLKTLDASWLLSMVALLFELAPLSPTRTADQTLREIERVLGVVCEHMPGAARPTYLLARARYLGSNVDGAQALLQRCIEHSSHIAEAYLLLSQVRVVWQLCLLTLHTIHRNSHSHSAYTNL